MRRGRERESRRRHRCCLLLFLRAFSFRSPDASSAVAETPLVVAPLVDQSARTRSSESLLAIGRAKKNTAAPEPARKARSFGRL